MVKTFEALLFENEIQSRFDTVKHVYSTVKYVYHLKNKESNYLINFYLLATAIYERKIELFHNF